MNAGASLAGHRVIAPDVDAVCRGQVRVLAAKSVWFLGMAGGRDDRRRADFRLAARWRSSSATTGIVLLFGHSLGSHRKLVHDSYQCPSWLECVFVYCGVQVGLAGPIGLLRQHELRDYAQRLPLVTTTCATAAFRCVDAWWQLNCELELEASARDPHRVARSRSDRFLMFLERTWMAQQLPMGAAALCSRRLGLHVLGRLRTCHGRRVRPLADRLPRAQSRRMHCDVRGAAVQGPQRAADIAAHHGRVLAQQPSCVPRLRAARPRARANGTQAGGCCKRSCTRWDSSGESRLPADLPPRRR